MLQLNLPEYSWINVHELSYNVKVAASPNGPQSFCKALAGYVTYMGLWYQSTCLEKSSDVIAHIFARPGLESGKNAIMQIINVYCIRRNQGNDKSRFRFLGSESVANMLEMSYFVYKLPWYTMNFLPISFLPLVTGSNYAITPCCWEVMWQQISFYRFIMH